MRELAEHVLDIAYNSVEAGAQRVRIEVIEDTQGDRLTLRVEDDGRGMTPDQVRRICDPFFTTRTTRRVGLGVPLLAEAARTCDGDLTVESAPGQGTTVTAWFRRSHVDRQPLGDMAATLVTLIAGAPGISWEYRHEVDGRAFEFSTAQVREEAGEVSLTDAAVIRWLQQYLKEHISALGEGSADMPDLTFAPPVSQEKSASGRRPLPKAVLPPGGEIHD